MLNVDDSDIDGPPLAVKCVRKFGSALVEKLRARAFVCVCVCVSNVQRGNLVYVLYIPRAGVLNVHCWFWLQFQTRHPWNPRNRPQNYGVVLALKLFLE